MGKIRTDGNIKRLTVVKVVEEGRVGGPQIDILRTSKELKSKGIDVIVVVPHVDSDRFQELLKISGVQVHVAKLTRPGKQVKQLIRYLTHFVFELSALIAFFRLTSPDLVHAGGGAWQIKGVLAAKYCRIPVVWHLNDTGSPRAVRMLFRWLKSIPVGFICAGECVRKYYFPNATQSNIVVIQSPVDCSEFSPSSAQAVPSEQQRDNRKPPLVVTVGNIGRVKGIEVFISAVNKVVAHKQVHARVLGAKLTSQKDYMSHIDWLIEECQLDHIVKISTPKSVAASLREAAVYVCASWSEASPIAVWEAMAAGLPVIATDVGEVSRFIKDGKTGYVVNRGADYLIAEKIIWVLENPEHAKEMGERARAVALMHFDQAKVAESQKLFYRKVLQG